MKALQFMSPGLMAVNEIAIPKIAEDEVLLASRSVGICHSDIELLEGRYIIPFQYPSKQAQGRRSSRRRMRHWPGTLWFQH